MRPRVLLLRPRANGEATAIRLAALGYGAMLAPVLEIAPLAFEFAAGGLPDALAATSANAVAALPRAVVAWHAVPFFAVGEATAAAARAAGFATVVEAGGDAAALAAVLVRDLPPGALLALLAGRPRKPDLEDALARAGRASLVLETYEARPAAWPDAIIRNLRALPPEAALHFSRRSASLALAAASAAGLQPLLDGMRHVCLSDDVAAALRGRIGGPIIVAEQPRTDSLLQALRSILDPM